MTTFEMLGRAHKVAKLVARFQEFGITSDHVRKMTAHDWCIACASAKVKPPSDETVRLVIEEMERMERPSVPFTDADAEMDQYEEFIPADTCGSDCYRQFKHVGCLESGAYDVER